MRNAPAAVQRAYSKFTVKSVDEGRRLISGIATTPSTDRMGDIVESTGAEFELPLPFLWQHDSMQPVGEVIAARATSTSIVVEVQMAQIDKPGKLFDRLEEAWQSVRIGLVKGLSIGFAPIEYSIIQETGGLRFTKWAWLELSAVTIPANADASISAIKRYDAKTLARLGSQSRGGVVLAGRGVKIAREGDGIPLRGSQSIKLLRTPKRKEFVRLHSPGIALIKG